VKHRGTRGQVKILAKSDGVHLSEVQRVHLGCRGRGTLKISMAMGMHFFVKQRGRAAGKWQWWGKNIFWLVLKVHMVIKIDSYTNNDNEKCKFSKYSCKKYLNVNLYFSHIK